MRIRQYVNISTPQKTVCLLLSFLAFLMCGNMGSIILFFFSPLNDCDSYALRQVASSLITGLQDNKVKQLQNRPDNFKLERLLLTHRDNNLTPCCESIIALNNTIPFVFRMDILQKSAVSNGALPLATIITAVKR